MIGDAIKTCLAFIGAITLMMGILVWYTNMTGPFQSSAEMPETSVLLKGC